MRTLLSEARSKASTAPEPQFDALQRELDRMNQRVSYQLRRARASGATGIGTEPVAVAPIVEDLKTTLDKVYRDKRVACTVDVVEGTVFRGDPGDLTEILGNVMDNAYKYCDAKVRVAGDSNGERLSIRVGDDGRGIGAELAQELGKRGKRADESVPGQGIGLAVVRETVELYRGTLSVGHSELGGAEITIELARAGAL
jgi:two-component system sensor histidine kinase PhoQ